MSCINSDKNCIIDDNQTKDRLGQGSPVFITSKFGPWTLRSWLNIRRNSIIKPCALGDFLDDFFMREISEFSENLLDKKKCFIIESFCVFDQGRRVRGTNSVVAKTGEPLPRRFLFDFFQLYLNITNLNNYTF